LRKLPLPQDGKAMATIIQLQPRKRNTDDRPGGPAKILLFTGVRYERMDMASEAGARRNKAARRTVRTGRS
jgi:hypothetical protein